ncbi:putative arginine--tRNA ligase-like protein [Dinothrombium tinctorium]|uniref:Probable arginine--tRNA ligase, mitochondrial n=1 Tax=Dinothrombium tinctorium TaxID=1965070 RepID=A0A443QPX1_9ACAR|nr:putative arginine--tRNA ligase-like protein [Dinothrombium tinctorium]
MSCLRNETKRCFRKIFGLNVDLRIDRDRSVHRKAPVFAVVFDHKKHENHSLFHHFANHPDSGFTKCLPQFVVDVNVEEHNNRKQLYLTIDRNTFMQKTLKTYSKNLEEHAKTNLADEINKYQSVIFEYCSPNIAKPFHFGHLRSTLIGNCLSNIHSYFGHNTNRINYLGDWGSQFGILSLGYDLFGDEQKLIKDPLRHLYDVYVRANKECEENEQFHSKAKERAMLLEKRYDEKVFLQWQRFREYSIEQYKGLFHRLGIQFDYIHSESMYSEASFEIVNMLSHRGLIEVLSDGAKVMKIKNNDNVTEIPLIRKDGATIYLTRDIAAAIHRKQQFNFDKMYYVVDNSQYKHFVNLKRILFEMGFEWESDMFHLPFGKVLGMSTRKGTAIFLQDIIDEANSRALKFIKESKYTKIEETEFEEKADILGLSAVIVNVLKKKRMTEFKFSWDEAIKSSLYDDSGIVLQYAHAKLCNLEKRFKIEKPFESNINLSAIQSEEAFTLLIALAQFDETLIESFHQLEPSILVKYLVDLRREVNRAYSNLIIRNETSCVVESRLLLYSAARNVLQKGLQLIGVKPLEAF